MSDSSTAPAANILTLSLPTDVLTGAGGGSGLNLSYNFGPNVDTIAKTAYGFLNQSFASSDAFQSAAAKSTQDFMASETMPIVTAAANESKNYYSQILDAFNSNRAAQSAIATLGVSDAASIGQSSIAASQNAQGGGSIFSSIFGGCFITTAVCKYSTRPDDCDLLQTMRAWRDGWMMETAERRKMVLDYYCNAPVYVHKIEQLPEETQRPIWGELERLIMTACHHIKCGSNDIALVYYLAAVEFARATAESFYHE